MNTQLRRLRADTVSATVDDIDDLPDPRLTIVAAWRPVHALCARLDADSRRRGRPFVPLIMEGATLSIGPVVRPDTGGCWHCWIRRRHQHEPSAVVRSVVAAYYDAHIDAGPRGYLEATALLGAAQLSEIISRIDRGECAGGELWQMNILTREVVTGAVISVDGCSHCGSGASFDRTFGELQRRFADWNGRCS